MRQTSSAKIQYALLAIVAVFSLLHAYGGAVGDLANLLHGTEMSQFPVYLRNGEPVVASVTPPAEKAGLAKGDVILSVNGRPLQGLITAIQEVRKTRPGELLSVQYLRPAPGSAIKLSAGLPRGDVRVAEIRPVPFEKRPVWATVLQTIFFIVPFVCLLTGLYVVLARPRSSHAWLILCVLAYSDAIFFADFFMPEWLIPLAIVWSSFVQTAMPICLMLFGITFPDRSATDRRLPWLKWVLMLPLLMLYPFDLWWSFGEFYNIAALVRLASLHAGVNVLEAVLSVTAICYFFFSLISRIRTSTGDARRRLRVLYAGTFTGLTPFLILLILALARGVSLDQTAPRWLFLICIVLLLLFPLSLAYVVVVQRAMDVRILIRQGTKYFFARHTLNFVRVLLGAWIAYELLQFFSGTAHQRTVDLVRISGIIGLFFAFRVVLSKRLQQKIDERFFREAYSSEQILSELSDEARNFTEADPLLATVTGRIGSALHIERIAVFLRSGETFRLQLATGMPSGANGSHALSLSSSSATITTLLREKAPAPVYRDDPSSWLVDASDAERLALQDLSTELLVPLPGRNRLIGVMALGPKRSEEPYSRSDRQLLQTVASQTGLALENAELLETLTTEIAARERVSREIEIAREVQERLFPQGYPSIEGLDMAGCCRPAYAVGGDYYDLFATGLGDRAGGARRLAVAVGDISGKGISAALLMASLRASLRSLSRLQESSGADDLGELMRHVNDLVYEASTANRYATFFFAELDPVARTLTYVNAGHNPPVILRGCDEVIPLPATGMVVGLLPGAEYTQARISLLPGDVLLAFTDGISEAMTAEEEEWGEERMIAAAQKLLGDRSCTYSAQQMVSCLIEEADRFTAGAPQHDDMTLLICRMIA